jgi:hypothetical protein
LHAAAAVEIEAPNGTVPLAIFSFLLFLLLNVHNSGLKQHEISQTGGFLFFFFA